MFIVNKFGILHSIPVDWEIPAGCRLASQAEIDCFQATGEQEVSKMVFPAPEAPATPKKDATK